MFCCWRRIWRGIRGVWRRRPLARYWRKIGVLLFSHRRFNLERSPKSCLERTCMKRPSLSSKRRAHLSHRRTFVTSKFNRKYIKAQWVIFLIENHCRCMPLLSTLHFTCRIRCAALTLTTPNPTPKHPILLPTPVSDIPTNALARMDLLPP